MGRGVSGRARRGAMRGSRRGMDGFVMGELARVRRNNR